MHNFPRVLVISNNCFSKSGSNGRTLGNFFAGWPLEKLAQFFIQDEKPDLPVCENFYRVTDSEALKAFMRGTHVGESIELQRNVDLHPNKTISFSKKREKTPLTALIRDVVWNSKRWLNSDFESWVNKFNPQVVLLQVGDSRFMIKIAMAIAKQRKIPLVIYNSESYYFKEKNFMKASRISSCIYPIYNFFYKKQFEKMITHAVYSIYICDMLKQVYDLRFSSPSSVIMTATDVVFEKKSAFHDVPVISYMGNLGVGRYESLIEIAKTLQQIDLKYCIDVYGKLPNSNVKNLLDNCKGINYKGYVKYENVISVMHKSDLLVHVENFSEYYKYDLQYAFSTKIADSLASGTCFFVYAPENMASSQYLLNNKAACVVTSKDDLQLALTTVIENENVRLDYIEQAKKVAENKHSNKNNIDEFRGILIKVVKNNESITN
jgi:glycosyltransferase involved in cell wall biosynthesis